jgi:hypothetical protein
MPARPSESPATVHDFALFGRGQRCSGRTLPVTTGVTRPRKREPAERGRGAIKERAADDLGGSFACAGAPFLLEIATFDALWPAPLHDPILGQLIHPEPT